MPLPKLWSKLESDSDVTSPQLGTGGAVVGSPTYVACKFNNGILSDVDNEGCTFPTAGNSINVNKGTIEFWAKLNFDETDGDYHWFFDFQDTSNGGINFCFHAGEDDFRAQVYSGGAAVAVALTAGEDWTTGDIMHFAVIWDKDGNDLGGGRTLVIKINNVEAASTTDTWSADTVLTNLSIGMTNGQTYHSDAVIDNLKTYDYCKLDFSDKDIEAGYQQQIMEII